MHKEEVNAEFDLGKYHFNPRLRELIFDGKTQVLFTHVGLVPQVECYDGCTKGWDQYIKGSLFKLLTKGKGEPGLRKKQSTH